MEQTATEGIFEFSIVSRITPKKSQDVKNQMIYGHFSKWRPE